MDRRQSDNAFDASLATDIIPPVLSPQQKGYGNNARTRQVDPLNAFSSQQAANNGTYSTIMEADNLNRQSKENMTEGSFPPIYPANEEDQEIQRHYADIMNKMNGNGTFVGKNNYYQR
jgi:hypothetical protein